MFLILRLSGKRSSSPCSLQWRPTGVVNAKPRASLPPGKETRYPRHRRLHGSQSLFSRVRKVSLPPGFELRTVQTEASRYTDWVTPAPSLSARRRKISHSGMGGRDHSTNFLCIKFIVNAILMCYGLPNWTQPRAASNNCALFRKEVHNAVT